MTKVLYIISSSKIGGGEMHLLHLLSKMKDDPDFEAFVFCMAGGELQHRLKRMSIPFQTFEMENLWDIGDIWRLGKAMKEINPSLVHCHLNRASLYGTLFAKFLKIPVIATAHGGVIETINNNKTGILVKPGSTDDMALAIKKIIENRELYATLASQGRDRIKRLFTKKIMCEKTLTLYFENLKHNI